MSDSQTSDSSSTAPRGGPGHADSYLSALKLYDSGLLAAILSSAGIPDRPPRGIASAIMDRLDDPGAIRSLATRLEPGPRQALALFAALGAQAMPARGLALALRLIGLEPAGSVRPLLESGLLAARACPGDGVPDFAGLFSDGMPDRVELIAHPNAGSVSALDAPEGGPTPAGEVGQIRESDGLEPVLRLAALWQRVSGAPLRRTQQGALFKRDRERLDDDPVLAGPIADAREPLPDMARLWLALAEGVGLVLPDVEPGAERLVAATAEYWSEHAVHLPQMLANAWLGLQDWDDRAGWLDEAPPERLSPAFARTPALLWLASLDEGAWVALDDLSAHLERLSPGWERALAVAQGDAPAKPAGRGGREKASADRDRPRFLPATLLGVGYQLGLVREAEEASSRRRLVQLTPLGRYVLGLGPAPSPRDTFEQFLFVQPNFEVIAYRQGLNTWLIGLFSRFLDWEQLGAAIQMKLTAESFYRGLEGGLAPAQILGRLERHGGRALPSGVAEAIKTWSGRRERLTFHTSATLVEFASPQDLSDALAEWPQDPEVAPPVPLTPRILLVADEAQIPLRRFRMAGSRDYRRPPEACVEVEPDGVTLGVDLGRSDLFVEAELARLAEEVPEARWPGPSSRPDRRRFRVTLDSIARALAEGMTVAQVERWFEQRSGSPIPASARLLIHAAASPGAEFRAARQVVLRAPSAALLDGLVQHPSTAGLIGERLGPDSASVPEGRVEGLRLAMRRLGLRLDISPEAGSPRVRDLERDDTIP